MNLPVLPSLDSDNSTWLSFAQRTIHHRMREEIEAGLSEEQKRKYRKMLASLGYRDACFDNRSGWASLAPGSKLSVLAKRTLALFSCIIALLFLKDLLVVYFTKDTFPLFEILAALVCLNWFAGKLFGQERK